MSVKNWVRRWCYWWTGDGGSPWVRLKWWATYRFIDDPHNPRMERCWARSVDWALGFESLESTLANSGNQRCQDEARSEGACYCCRFACRSALMAQGCDPEALKPDRWVEP